MLGVCLIRIAVMTPVWLFIITMGALRACAMAEPVSEATVGDVGVVWAVV